MTVQVCPTAEKDSMKIESFLFVKPIFMDPIPYRYTPGSRMITSKKKFNYFHLIRFQNQNFILSLCRSAKDHAVVVELVDTLA